MRGLPQQFALNNRVNKRVFKSFLESSKSTLSIVCYYIILQKLQKFTIIVTNFQDCHQEKIGIGTTCVAQGYNVATDRYEK